MQQPQQKRHKLLTIAKPNKQNAGRNKGKTLKTAAGYKSAMGGGYEEVGGLVLGGPVGQWVVPGQKCRRVLCTDPFTHTKQTQTLTHYGECACCVNN